MKISEVGVLFRDGHDIGPIIAVQDYFGKTYRRLRGVAMRPGEVFSAQSITHSGSKCIVNFRVFSPADTTEVKRLIHIAGYDGRRMARDGGWYEGMSD